eukprot:gnl/Hemi2/2517_TR892_c0_g2_i1.p1 gnl/Hemi2/2517_TR892_c0_g2~~gnl/Hemi2/2517_TR892_c0_g2_i1.p1  ORF type:complete len:456 (+),score=153.23 gnl/Hemi2/2517_TR892_c0_g2_i1:70-1437(+)
MARVERDIWPEGEAQAIPDEILQASRRRSVGLPCAAGSESACAACVWVCAGQRGGHRAADAASGQRGQGAEEPGAASGARAGRPEGEDQGEPGEDQDEQAAAVPRGQHRGGAGRRPNDKAEEDGATVDLDAQRKGKCVVLKTSTRQTVFLPVVGLVDAVKLKPGDLVGVNKDSYLVLDSLPPEYDSRVKAMEVDEKPTESYGDVGGLEKQITELHEAVVLPMTHKERFLAIGIKPPKGVLMYGPPGTGKTLLARAVAAQTKATFLKLAGPQLVQMFIGDGAKLVRDAFALAKEKSPCIIFIDELDAIGTKRFDSELSGDREVQRTMLELLNQLDGFSSTEDIKVLAATNRIDILDPALLRSGRLDRKIEFPLPTAEARQHILKIHANKMNVRPDINYEELARCTDDFNGAQLKAVCVEAGMLALRRNATEINHEDFVEGVSLVQQKKKMSLQYYA